MEVTRFLEHKWVIRFFGVALILAPFFNLIIQLLFLNSKSGISWKYISFKAYLMSGSFANYLLAFCSIVIGAIMLSGRVRAWKYVLILVGSHLLVQILNYKSKAWQGPLAWIAFSVNLLVFLFIADQLVLKQMYSKKTTDSEDKNEAKPQLQPQAQTQEIKQPERVLNLNSYKKIFFSFDSDKPWGRLTTLTSHQLIVTCFTKAPDSIENKVVQINFTKDLIIDIKFDRKESNLYYFTPLNMSTEKVNKLNQWLKKIAV